MAADFPTFRKKVFERYPIMRSTAFERRMLFGRGGQRQVPQRPVLVADAPSLIRPTPDLAAGYDRPRRLETAAPW